MKYRLRDTNFSLMDLCSDLNRHNRKVAAASCLFPFPLSEESDLLECLDKWDGPLYQSITPRCSIGKYKLYMYTSNQMIFNEIFGQPQGTGLAFFGLTNNKETLIKN